MGGGGGGGGGVANFLPGSVGTFLVTDGGGGGSGAGYVR